MPHTFAQNIVHLVFSTKERQRFIRAEFQPRLWTYTAGVCKNLDIHVREIGGMEDHIHLLIQIPAKVALAKAVVGIKANSSRWVNDQGHKFGWQEGYGAFSVSASIAPTVERYIRNQREHHRKMNFEQEFLALLKKHEVEFDSRYVFG